MLYDNLKDILKHTHDLGFVKIVKIYDENNETKVETISENNSVVLYGKLENRISELADTTIGFSRMSILKGYINFAPFNTNKSEINITTQNRGGVEVPCEISFKSDLGHHAHYRFMLKEQVERAVPMPTFLGATWNIKYEPTQRNLVDLQYFNNILGSDEGLFSVISENKELKMSIGSGPTDRSVIPFATNIKGRINDTWRWPLSEVLSILKLSSTGVCTMYFSNSGALKITIDSGLGIYDYYLPGKN